MLKVNIDGHISVITVGVRQAGTRTVAAASVTVGQDNNY
jgi:ribosomal protein L27